MIVLSLQQREIVAQMIEIVFYLFIYLCSRDDGGLFEVILIWFAMDNICI